MTHKLVKGFRDAVELGVGEPRVERQRERRSKACAAPGNAPWSR